MRLGQAGVEVDVEVGIGVDLVAEPAHPDSAHGLHAVDVGQGVLGLFDEFGLNAVHEAAEHVTCGGAPAYVWPGGGITVMVDVTRMPDDSFGTVPTPALVAPIEFTMRRADYLALGGHAENVRSLEQVLRTGAWHNDGAPTARRWHPSSERNPWPLGQGPMLG